MAAGEVVWFDQALADIANAVHNLESNTINIGLISSATTPAANTADPCWGAGGSTNMSTNKVGEATAWTGPRDLSGTCSLVGGKMKFERTDFPLKEEVDYDPAVGLHLTGEFERLIRPHLSINLGAKLYFVEYEAASATVDAINAPVSGLPNDELHGMCRSWGNNQLRCPCLTLVDAEKNSGMSITHP